MKLKRWLSKYLVVGINVLAMLMVVQTANSACIWLVHQPKFPEEAKAFARKK